MDLNFASQRLTNTYVSTLPLQKKAYEKGDSDLKGFIIRVESGGTKTYYFSYRNASGKKKRIKIGRHGTVLAPVARDRAEKLAASVVHGMDVQQEKKETIKKAEIDKTKTLKSFLDLKYEAWLLSNNKGGDSAIKTIKRNFDWLMDKAMDEITIDEMQSYRLKRLQNDITKTSINREISDLRSMLSRAVEWEIIERHPLQKLRPLKEEDNKRVRYLNKTEEEQLRNALADREARIIKQRESANIWRKERGYKTMKKISTDEYVDHLQPIVLLAVNTGMRRGEIFQLLWENVHLERKQLTVLASTEKTGKTRHIPLNNEAYKLLLKWRKSSKGKVVFPNKDGKVMNNIGTSWQNLIEDAAIEDFHFHDLRHHFASSLVMAGVDLLTIKELLGHADLKMTIRYAHLAPEHKAAAVAKLDNR